jgi:tRNA (guanine37-N1)-methyltransferase
MRFDIITIFPDMLKPFVNESMIKRAQEKGKVEINIHDLRIYSKDKHKKVDDRPFGGGPGMVMTCQPMFDAIKKIKGKRKAKVLLMSPSGTTMTQKKARELGKERNLIIICGHYEGIDDRIRLELVDESISIGDYVLTGGELPALVLVDCITRLIPGVLGTEDSLVHESFENNLLDFPQFTRPANFHGIKVPDVLISGHHADIEKWRQEQSVALTKKYRPDLFKKKK